MKKKPKAAPKPKAKKKPYNSLGKGRMYDGSGNGCYPDYPIYADDRN